MLGQNGVDLITEYEGWVPYLYNDAVGHATVGYGYLVHFGNYHPIRGTCPKPVGRGNCDHWPRAIEPHLYLTKVAGKALFQETVKVYNDWVIQYTRKDLNQNGIDSMTSLAYNIGRGGYSGSSVRTAVNGYRDPCPYLRTIITGTNGIVYPGLVRRREAECRLYHSPTQSMPVEDQEIDDMNMILAPWWTTGKINGIPHNGWFGPGRVDINCFADFGPGRLYETIIALEADSTGEWAFHHGIVVNGQFPLAERLLPGQFSKQVIMVPGHYGTIPTFITGRIHVKYVALTGVIR